MNPRPIAVKPLNGFKLLVTFKNNEQKIFDINPLLDIPMYRKLKDNNLFFQAKVDGMCVYWNDDIDICPDMLYENSVSL